MAVGPPIQVGAVGEPPIWVGERGVPTGRAGRSNGRKMPAPMGPLAALLGDSPGIIALRESATRLLQHPSDRGRLPPLLIQGETGVGKGLLARMLHEEGPRAEQPFVPVNCAAIPETLLESELFGFERGAFTDARQPKAGLFQTANRGTLFLDEVALLPDSLQAKLLKVLEDRAVRRLGATRTEPVDVWIITASNEDLATAVDARRFRKDLYHRLAVVTLRLPPLRERGADVVLLARALPGRGLRRIRPGSQEPRAGRARGAPPAFVARERPGARQHDGAGGPPRRRRGGDGGDAGHPPRGHLRRGAGRPARPGPRPRRHAGRGRADAAPRGARRDVLERDARRPAARDLPRHAALPHHQAPAPAGRIPARPGAGARARDGARVSASAGDGRGRAGGDRPLGAPPRDTAPRGDRRPAVRRRPLVPEPPDRGAHREGAKLRRPGGRPRPERHRGHLRPRARRGRDAAGRARGRRDPQGGRAGAAGRAAVDHDPAGYPRHAAPGGVRRPGHPARARRQASRLASAGRPRPAGRSRPDRRLGDGRAVPRPSIRAGAAPVAGPRRRPRVPAGRGRARRLRVGPPADRAGRPQPGARAPARPLRVRGRRARTGRRHRGRGRDRKVPAAPRVPAEPPRRAHRLVRGPLSVVRERRPLPARHRDPPAELPHRGE